MRRGTEASARILFAASGLAVASLSLLPGAVVLLLLLLDRTAHALLGLSGAFLSIAGSVVPGGGGGGGALPPYVALPLGASATVMLSLCRALPALCGLVLAARASTPLVRRLSAIDAALTAAAACPSRVLILAALPGVLATVALLAAPPPPRRGASQIM